MLQQKGTTSKMVLVVLFAVYALLSAGGLVLFKLGGQDAALQLGKTGFSLTLSWKMLLGIFCYLCSFFAVACHCQPHPADLCHAPFPWAL